MDGGGGVSFATSAARYPNNAFNLVRPKYDDGFDKKKTDKKPKYKQQYIPSSFLCGRCLFNIPSGTLLWLLPSLMLLCMGVVMIVLDRDGLWFEGLLQAGIIFAALGGALSIGTMIYCAVQWTKQKPKGSRHIKRTPRLNNHMVQTGTVAEGGVQLVGIYRIKGQDNPAYLSSQENVSATRGSSSSPKLETVPEEVIIITKQF